MPDPKPAKPSSVRLILALIGLALVLVAGGLWSNRKGLAREALTGWLKSKGVAAQAEVQTFGASTFTARLTLGDPRHPDFAADQAEVRYSLGPGGLQVRSVTLRRPVLRARLHAGQFSLGSLDPLVKEFLARPPPAGRQPRMTVENGLLLLDTDYGPVRLAANAMVDDSKLVSLAATSAATRLKGPAFDADLGEARITEATGGGRIVARLDAPIARLGAQGASARATRLQLKLQGPYPDLRKHRGDGALVLSATASGGEITYGGRSVARATLSGGFVGKATGWIPDLVVTGRATADLRGEGAALGGGQVKAVRATLVADDVRWTRKGGDRIAATLKTTAGLDGLSMGAFSLASLTTTASGPVTVGAQGLDLSLTASAVGHGAWAGLGPPGPADDPQLATLKRATRAFTLSAPQMTLAMKDGAATLGLPKPVRVTPDTGGAVEVAVRNGAPLIGPRGGLRLTSSGGGLPAIEADVSGLTFTPQGSSAALKLHAHGSLGVLQDGDVDLAGRLRARGGGLTFDLDRCAALKVARLDFGASDVERLAAQLCPAGGPLFVARDGDWQAAVRILGLSADAPFGQGRVSGGAINVRAADRRGALTVNADVLTGQIEDTAPATRFNPFALTGHAALAEYVWTADLAARQPGGTTVGRVHVVHDGGLGVGFVTLTTETLTFVEGGLQPAQLSPLASVVGSPVTGQARFDGRFDWARAGVGSSGSVSLKDLNFTSPVGKVEGLNGHLAFSSLSPLTAAPGQSLDIGSIQAIVPLTHLRARFAVADNLLKIAGGEADVGGGRILVESLEAPLTADAPTRGVLVFEGVQLHDLIEASPMGDKVDLDARVSGRVTFEATGQKVRISSGELKAIEPGRLSIDRTALTDVQSNGEAVPVAGDDPNAAFNDIAYQAMEHLAFDTLELSLASREDGRLGALFHIVGRHDPPTKQKLKISVIDLIRKRFSKKLPLPSGTQVNLTLDTSLNLDDLLGDYAEFRRLHGSGSVQP